MNERKFILNLVLIIFVNLLIKPLYVFGIDRGIQNAVGIESYGMFYALFNLGFVFSIILDPGITSYNNRHIAQNNNALAKYISNIIPLKVLLGLLYFIALAFYAYVSGFESYEAKLLAMLGLGHLFNSFVLYFRSNLAALHLFKWDTFISILDKLIMIVVFGLIFFYPEYFIEPTVMLFAFIQSISFLIAAAFAGFLILKETGKLLFTIEWEFSKKIIKESLPFTLLATLMFLYSKIDTLILKELHPFGNAEVGYYAAAYRLIDALNMIAVLFAGLLYPIFARMISLEESLEPLSKIAFSLLVVPAILASILFISYGNEIMDTLYTAEITKIAPLFAILGISFVGTCCTYVFGTLLTANGDLRTLNMIAGLTALASLILNILFSAHYGATASAIIAALCFLGTGIAHAIICFRKFNFRLRLNYLLRALLAFSLIIIAAYIFRSYDNSWLIESILLLLFAALLFIILRLIPIQEFYKVALKQPKS